MASKHVNGSEPFKNWWQRGISSWNNRRKLSKWFWKCFKNNDKESHKVICQEGVSRAALDDTHSAPTVWACLRFNSITQGRRSKFSGKPPCPSASVSKPAPFKFPVTAFEPYTWHKGESWAVRVIYGELTGSPWNHLSLQSPCFCLSLLEPSCKI